MLNLIEKNDTNPICPYCGNTLTSLWYQLLTAWLGKRYIYFCPHCSKFLGVSHRKGFWMG